MIAVAELLLFFFISSWKILKRRKHKNSDQHNKKYNKSNKVISSAYVKFYFSEVPEELNVDADAWTHCIWWKELAGLNYALYGFGQLPTRNNRTNYIQETCLGVPLSYKGKFTVTAYGKAAQKKEYWAKDFFNDPLKVDLKEHHEPSHKKPKENMDEEVYDLMTDKSSSKFIDKLAVTLGNLASENYFNITLQIDKPTSIKLIAYKLECDKQAEKLKEHEEVRKAEISHRYYKALKLAGAYAFIADSQNITEEILFSAIKLVASQQK